MKQLLIGLLGMSLAGGALAHDEDKVAQMPPEGPYVQVSEVLPLPAFLPGLGTLFVDPDTLPAGPFLSYDHDGKLSATVYMTPLEELKNGVAYDDLAIGSHEVTAVDIYYNAGHPGVESPHAHVVLFHDKGAFKKDGESLTTLEGLKQTLQPSFELINQPQQIPFARRETQNRFQFGYCELTIWKQRAVGS